MTSELPTSPGELTFETLADAVLKCIFDLLHVNSLWYAYSCNNKPSSLASLTNALFNHVFPQFGEIEHHYLFKLLEMGRSLCKSFMKQRVNNGHQHSVNAATVLQDALPYMALLNGCTAHVKGDPDCPQLKLNVNGQNLNAILDTGAKVTLINKQLFDQIPWKCKTPLCPSILKLRAANMSEIDNAGVSDITFKLGNTMFCHKFVVSKSLGKEILLGVDFIFANKIKLLYHDDHSPYLEFGMGDTIDLVEKYPIDVTVKVADSVKLPPYHFTVVECFVSQCSSNVCQAGDVLHIAPTTKYSDKADTPILQDSTISYQPNGKAFLIMANHTPQYHTIRKNTIVGVGSLIKPNSIEVIEICQIEPDIPTHAPVNNYTSDLVGLEFNQPLLESDADELAALSEVPPEINTALQNLLSEYNGIFAKDETEIGLTHLLKMDIDTGDHPPISL